MGGLKFRRALGKIRRARPIPHGMGGLKSGGGRPQPPIFQSHPTRDGWIELQRAVVNEPIDEVPSHTGWVD